MGFFSVDSPFYRFISRFWDIVQINLLWVLFSLPIITIGASTAAAFHVCLKMVDDEEGYIGRQFLEGFKENWKQGTVLGFLTLLCAYSVYLDVQIFDATPDNPIVFLIIAMVSAFIFILCLIYAFPLIARYRNGLLKTIKNSYKLSRRYFGRTLMLVVILAVEYVVWFFNTTTLIIGLFIGPACMIFTIAGMALGIFRLVEKEPGAVVADEKPDATNESAADMEHAVTKESVVAKKPIANKEE